MGSKRYRNGAWEYQFRNKLLGEGARVKRFKNEAEGDRFNADVEKSLARGVVPEALQADPVKGRKATVDSDSLRSVMSDYRANNQITREDHKILRLIGDRIPGGTAAADVDFDWVEIFVRSLKLNYALAPSTIRKHCGALSRCVDWAINKKRMTDNPFKRLKRGFMTYTSEDIRAGAIAKEDVERDRRLEAGEEKRIRELLAGAKPEGRQRPVAQIHNSEMRLMFELALETAMRMREIYTLTTDQVNLDQRTIFLARTKNGDSRQVPLSTRACTALDAYIKDLDGAGGRPLFPVWWHEGASRPQLERITTCVSRLFQTLFEAAGCDGLHFHDLRHEAISRLFEQTSLSDFEIAKISGHRTSRMLMRYANLRGSKLADMRISAHRDRPFR